MIRQLRVGSPGRRAFYFTEPLALARWVRFARVPLTTLNYAPSDTTRLHMTPRFSGAPATLWPHTPQIHNTGAHPATASFTTQCDTCIPVSWGNRLACPF